LEITMKRREALRGIGLGIVVLATPGFVRAQQSGRLPTVGLLSEGSPGSPSRAIEAFVQGLNDLGYVDGKNLKIEYRYSERKPERLPEVAVELIALKPDVIVTESGTAALHLKKATQTIPIVMGGSGNPVGQGLVASLERPGGNVTGLTDWAPDMMKDRLQVLDSLVPNLARLGVLWPGPGNPVMEREWADASAAAKQLGLQLHPMVMRTGADLPVLFEEAARQKVQAIVIFSMPTVIVSSGQQIAELAVKHGIPVTAHIPRYPMMGGLMSYGANPFAFFRQAASYVDRILKGANPAELPVEGPKKAMLVINRPAAKAIGLTLPPQVLARADEVIDTAP
jgi:putative tryptophan/tyrosine transport system substrate-binding protein